MASFNERYPATKLDECKVFFSKDGYGKILGIERGNYSILLYSKTTTSLYLESSAEGYWTCHNDLTKGVTYYIKVSYRVEGKASISVKDLAFIVED